MMLPEIVEVEPRSGYRIWIRFADGVQGEVDLSDLVGRGVFKAWLKTGFFERVFIDREAGTVAWPGGIDLAPEVLHEDVNRVSTT